MWRVRRVSEVVVVFSTMTWALRPFFRVPGDDDGSDPSQTAARASRRLSRRENDVDGAADGIWRARRHRRYGSPARRFGRLGDDGFGRLGHLDPSPSSSKARSRPSSGVRAEALRVKAVADAVQMRFARRAASALAVPGISARADDRRPSRDEGNDRGSLVAARPPFGGGDGGSSAAAARASLGTPPSRARVVSTPLPRLASPRAPRPETSTRRRRRHRHPGKSRRDIGAGAGGGRAAPRALPPTPTTPPRFPKPTPASPSRAPHPRPNANPGAPPRARRASATFAAAAAAAAAAGPRGARRPNRRRWTPRRQRRRTRRVARRSRRRRRRRRRAFAPRVK